MATPPKTEFKPDPVLEPMAAVQPETTVFIEKPSVPEPGPKLDQLSRVEDKTARIEEKFARSEERMMRVESALEKATIRLEGATQDMNLQAVKDDLARLRHTLRRTPGVVTLFVVALLAALVGAGASYALIRFGIPGVLPSITQGLLPR